MHKSDLSPFLAFCRVVICSSLLQKENELAVRERDTSGPSAWAAGRSEVSLRLTFGVVKLPSQNILILPRDERGTVLGA